MSAIQNETTTATRDAEKINLEAFADLLTDSIILSKLDLGRALVYKVKHPRHGNLVLINTAGDDNAAVYM